MAKQTPTPSLEKNQPARLNAWAMYDWANSVYSLTITTAVFPVYYSSINPDTVQFFAWKVNSSSLYSYALSFSFLVVMLLSPLLTGIADYSGKKKGFMQFFCYLGSLSCAAMFFYDGPAFTDWAIVLAVLASIGYAGSIVFYNAFLPEIATEDRYDQVSAKGFSLGYIGSVLLLIVNLVLIMSHSSFGLDKSMASRISFLSVGIWWAGFAQITFRRLPDNLHHHRPSGNYLLNGFRELKKVARTARAYPYLVRFLLSFFLYSMGVQTVMYLATIFGEKELNMGAAELIPIVLVIQLVAILGAYLSSLLSQRMGNTRVLSLQVLIWILIATAAYFIETAEQYYAIAVAVGLVMGGIQALSRSTYSKLIPDETIQTASFFSFYDVLEKAAIVLGTLYFGLSLDLTGDMRNALIGLDVFFLVALMILWFIPSQRIYRG